MSKERYQRITDLFRVASELPIAEREAWLLRQCDDEPLRAEVLELLAHDEQPNPGLTASDSHRGRMIQDALRDAQDVDAGTGPGDSTVPTLIGPYRLLEKVGEGGMGAVYAAEQLQPIQRPVALKLVKAGMDSAAVVARFETERQTLALMAHPNVAQVFDGGATDEGRPYFVMELVEGEPITDACDARDLSTRERVELFLGVCDGVQHAHQKGVIHRDLKPSNVLVTEYDGRPVPKIIDFGVARATTGSLAERTLHTTVGQMVGTLDYMSPEQADPTQLDVDTRSDVYSLGVLLYQLVSGLMPFEHSSATDVPLSEVQRAIREVDPLTPSTRLRRQTSRGAAAEVASRHGTDERTLIRQLSGDLDWITLKALEKDPDRRYQSAAALADDLRRHLAELPVLAGRPGALYRARKFVRRHRVGVTAGALVIAGLVSGAVGIVSGRLEAEENARIAGRNAERAEQERANVLRLSASVDLEELQRESDEELWPVTPDKLPAYDDWLRRARALVAALEPSADGNDPGLRAQLAALRGRALPWNREEHPRFAELQEKRAVIAEARAQLDEARTKLGDELSPGQAAVLAKAEKRIAVSVRERDALEALVDEPKAFANDDDTWWHQQLTPLVADLVTLSDPISGLIDGTVIDPETGWSVTRRRELVSQLAERSITGPVAAARWAEAIASITDEGECPAYAGLTLAPQFGLLPIGRDPDTGLWEFAHLMSGEPAERDPATGRIRPSGAMGMVLTLLPGGVDMIGADAKNELGNNYDPANTGNRAPRRMEGPPYEAQIAPFFLSKYEMTQAQWARSVSDWETPPDDPEWLMAPQSNVTLRQMLKTTRRLGLTLPTEEQWEYAARAGTDTPWSTGQDETSLKGSANLYDETALLKNPGLVQALPGRPVPWEDGYPFWSPVGHFEPNGFGLHDVHGNVAEFCLVVRSLYTDPPLSTPLTHAVKARGGSYEAASYAARSACRIFTQGPDFAQFGGGLRPARTLDP